MGAIIFINRFFYPDLSATSQLLTDLTTNLAEGGKNVKVVTGQRLYHNRGERLPGRESYHGIEIRRIRATNFSRFGLLGRAVDFSVFYLLATLELLLITRPGDILIAKTDPPLMSVLVRLVGSFRRAKTINWLQDIFPEIAEQLGILPNQSRVGGMLRRLRNWSLNYADANVVLGNKMQQKLISLGTPENKIHIIPNWADEKLIVPLKHSRNPLRKKWGLEGKFIIEYSGNMGRAHDFEAIIDAAIKLKNHPTIVFLWIGGGVKQAQVQAAAKKEGLTNFLFKDYQPKRRLRESLSIGDIHLVVLSPKLEGLIVPSKFYGIAAAGRPIIFIGDTDGELANVIRRSECGYAFGHDDADLLAEKFLALSRDFDTTSALGQRARKLLENEYGMEVTLSKWTSLFGHVQRTKRAKFFAFSGARQ